MSNVKLKNGVYWIGVTNPELRVFDIIMETKRGTTYNSYLIEDEKIAIIDTVKDGYFDEFLDNIKSIIGERKPDYIIVQHTELDHSGSLAKLLKEFPEAVVVGSKAANIYLKNIINADFRHIDAPQELSLGEKTLKFIMAPNLHWPDTMFTYLEKNKILFTCDFLGCHYCPAGCITDECSGDYFDEMKYYFDVIMGPFKRFVRSALKKIDNIEFDMVAPSHGPVHIGDLSKYLKLYEKWAEEKLPSEKNVQIFYVSAYGNTQKMAEYLAEAINKKGISCKANEITSMKITDIIDAIEGASGILMGSPTINQDAVKPVWDVLSMVCAITNRAKAAAAFGSYGWSGEGVLMMTERLKSLKFKVVDPGLKFNFVPNANDFKNADELVEKFIDIL